MNKSLSIIIQSRTGSKRLPNKMIMPFYQQKTILDVLLERLKPLQKVVPIVLATTCNDNDDKIVGIAEKNNVEVFRGSETDVLLRFINAAEKYNADRIIRICGDNPFLSKRFLEELIDCTKQTPEDYVSFVTNDGIPAIKTHFGLWAEYVTLDALCRIKEMTSESLYHEHVTNYAYMNPGLFSLKFIPISKHITELKFRLTVDTLDDFVNAKKVYEQLVLQNKEIEPENIIPLLDSKILASMQNSMNKNSK